MLITLPGEVLGAAHPTSVLDLDPLVRAFRECRPDAVRLPVPIGADDQPNGAALSAIRDRLEAQGVALVPEPWVVPAATPVEDSTWQTGALFELKALLAALFEAGIGPLVVDWRPAAQDAAGRAALVDFLERLREAVERGGVPVAVQNSLPARDLCPLVRELDSPLFGVCLPARGVRPTSVALAGDRLLVVRLDTRSRSGGEAWRGTVSVLRKGEFAGPLMLEGDGSRTRAAYALGYLRGLLATQG
jgi:hypothetical protein